MAKNIEIKKTVYTKDNFNKVVDREFKSFKQPAEVPVEKTVDQFFKDYEDLYLDIPIEGDEKSHRYLYNRSGELLDIQDAETNIQPLLDEIAELRQLLLESQQEIIDQRIEMAQMKADEASGTI